MFFKKKAAKNNIAESLNKYLVGLNDSITDCKYYISVFAGDIDKAIEKAKDVVNACVYGTARSIQNWTLLELMPITDDIRVKTSRQI
jgi:hypothetical protein